MFSCKSFIVSGLTFRVLIHFEFIFVYGVRKCSNFILLNVAVPVFPAPLIEEAVFSPLYILASFIKDKVTICAEPMVLLIETAHLCQDLPKLRFFCLGAERIQQEAKWQAKSEFITMGCS